MRLEDCIIKELICHKNVVKVEDYLMLQRVSMEQINKYPIAILYVIKIKFGKKQRKKD